MAVIVSGICEAKDTQMYILQALKEVGFHTVRDVEIVEEKDGRKPDSFIFHMNTDEEELQLYSALTAKTVHAEACYSLQINSWD